MSTLQPLDRDQRQTNGPTTFGSLILKRGSYAKACGNKGADIWPDFNWNKAPRRARPLGNSFADCESIRSVGDRRD
jgi:hypothetical protein